MEGCHNFIVKYRKSELLGTVQGSLNIHIVFPLFHQRTSQYPTLLRLVIYSLLFTTTASEQSWCGDIVMLGERLQSPAASHLATQQVDRDQDPEQEDGRRIDGE